MTQLDHTAYPHLLSSIIAFAPRDSLLALRPVSRDVRNAADAELGRHISLHIPPPIPTVRQLEVLNADGHRIPAWMGWADAFASGGLGENESALDVGGGAPSGEAAARISRAVAAAEVVDLPWTVCESFERDTARRRRPPQAKLFEALMPRYARVFAAIPFTLPCFAQTVVIFTALRRPEIDEGAWRLPVNDVLSPRVVYSLTGINADFDEKPHAPWPISAPDVVLVLSHLPALPLYAVAGVIAYNPKSSFVLVDAELARARGRIAMRGGNPFPTNAGYRLPPPEILEGVQPDDDGDIKDHVLAAVNELLANSMLAQMWKDERKESLPERIRILTAEEYAATLPPGDWELESIQPEMQQQRRTRWKS